jgi:hypothetical protein
MATNKTKRTKKDTQNIPLPRLLQEYLTPENIGLRLATQEENKSKRYLSPTVNSSMHFSSSPEFIELLLRLGFERFAKDLRMDRNAGLAGQRRHQTAYEKSYDLRILCGFAFQAGRQAERHALSDFS